MDSGKLEWMSEWSIGLKSVVNEAILTSLYSVCWMSTSVKPYLESVSKTLAEWVNNWAVWYLSDLANR